MTKEQAIENLEEIIELAKDEINQNDKNITATLDLTDLKSLETVLSMLKEKNEQIEEYRKIGLRTHKQQVQTKKSLKGIINNQKKIIDLMAETINFIDIDIKTIQRQIKEQYCDYIKSDVDCCWKTDKNCTDCIKEYFENKAKELLNK